MPVAQCRWHGARPSPLCPRLQVLWTFSIYLEAVAILPQLVLMQRTQNIDNLTANYVFLLGYAAPFGVAGITGGRGGRVWVETLNES